MMMELEEGEIIGSVYSDQPMTLFNSRDITSEENGLWETVRKDRQNKRRRSPASLSPMNKRKEIEFKNHRQKDIQDLRDGQARKSQRISHPSSDSNTKFTPSDPDDILYVSAHETPNENETGSFSEENMGHENSREFIWPFWVDPDGYMEKQSRKYQIDLDPVLRPKDLLRRMEPFVEVKKMNPIEYPTIDTSDMKNEKAVLCGDGWKRIKHEGRVPSLHWRISKTEEPQDPRLDIKQKKEFSEQSSIL